MKMEDIEALAVRAEEVGGQGVDFGRLYDILEEVLSALRAEAWHPIEKAAKLGAKDGRWVLCYETRMFYPIKWVKGRDRWEDEDACWPGEPTHFRFINPPEGA